MKKKTRSNWKLAVLAPFLLGVGLMLAAVLHYGVNVPYWDEWEMVPLFQKIDNHALGFSDLWQQHNEHRIPLPNIVLIVSAYTTRWNIKGELLINIFFSLITALILYLFVLKKVTQKILAVPAAALIAAWYFSPVQYENWLWGWQVEWFMCIAAAILTVYLLEKFASSESKYRKQLFIGSIFTAFAATFSLGSGILIWIVGTGILAAHKQSKKIIAIWLGGFLLSVLTYYHNYHKPPNHPSTTYFLHHPLHFVNYIFAYLGRPISDDINTAILIGSILACFSIPLLYLVWLKRAYINKFIPWLSLMVFALMADVITAVSRLGFGLEQSMASRYTTISILFIIGLIGLVFTLLDSIKLSRQSIIFSIILAFAVCAPLLSASYRNGVLGLQREKIAYLEKKYCTHNLVPTDSCIQTIYPGVQVGQNRLEYVKSKHWAGY